MDSVESIAAYSTAMSQARLQDAVSIKVLKMAQNSQQMVGDMLTQALDNVAESMKSAGQGTSGGIDTIA